MRYDFMLVHGVTAIRLYEELKKSTEPNKGWHKFSSNVNMTDPMRLNVRFLQCQFQQMNLKEEEKKSAIYLYPVCSLNYLSNQG